MTDHAFLPQRALGDYHRKSLERQAAVEAKAQELRDAMTMIDVMDALDSKWNSGRQGEAFVRELLAFAKSDDTDDAELGRLVKYALRHYFVAVADQQVDLIDE